MGLLTLLVKLSILPGILFFALQSQTFLSILQTNRTRFFYHTAGVKDIALTLDDGPNANSTQQILAVLKKHSVKATFFIIGLHAKQNPSLMKAIVSHGHEVQNHDYLDRCSVLQKSNLPEAVQKTEDILRSYVSRSPKYFRPGCGLYDSGMITSLSDYKLVLGNIYPHDILTNLIRPTSWLVQKYLLFRANPGSIIILHDKPRIYTPEVLDYILPLLKQDGYTFRTVSEMERLYPDT